MKETRSMKRVSLFGLVLIVLTGMGAASVQATGIEWVGQFGAPGGGGNLGFTYACDIDIDEYIYVGGHTSHTLPDQTSSGSIDAFVSKYDVGGEEIWTRQFGTAGTERAWGISVGPTGIHVCGGVYGVFPDQAYMGQEDAFVRKYDTNGDEVWTRQFGSVSTEAARDIFADANGYVYVCGGTLGTLPDQTSAGGWDCFLRKYDADGEEMWTRQFGSSGTDGAGGVFADADGNVYVCGITWGTLPDQTSLGDHDAFIRKYDTDGNEVWTRQFGTPGLDAAKAPFVDIDGDIYVVGNTYGAFTGQPSAGDQDPFVRKYDSSGNTIWTRQFGTPERDRALAIFVGPSGIYVAGDTYGALSNQTNIGRLDAYARVYTTDGNEVWTLQFGTPEVDKAWGIVADPAGVYMSGDTWGTFPGQTGSGGHTDAFVASLIADPTTLLGVLIELVQNINLQQGISNSLDAKLQRAQDALGDLNQNNDIAAVNALEAFVNEVQAQRGNKIPKADADALIAHAQTIIDMLAQGGGGGQAGATPSLTADKFILLQNCPNPFRTETAVSFSLSRARQTRLTVYDVTGRPVEILIDDELRPGVHTVTWKPDVPAGTYFYRLSTGSGTLSRKMAVVR